MEFSRAITQAVENYIIDTLPGKLSRDFPCEGAKFHSPRPLIVAEVELRNGNKVHLCGGCRDNLLVLEELLRKCDGSLPWPVRREFGNQLRSLVPMGKLEGAKNV